MLSYENTKIKEINNLITLNILKILREYKTEKVQNLLLNTITNFLINSTEQELNDIAYINTIESLPIKRKSAFLTLFNFNSNFFESLIDLLWDNAFLIGIKHCIGDILFNVEPFATKNTQNKKLKEFSLIDESVAEFTREDDIKENKKTLKLLRKNINRLDELNISDETIKKVVNLTATQKLKFLESIQDISNFNKKAQAVKKDYLGSNYIKSRKRVLSLDYARKYDKQVKTIIKDYLNTDLATVKSIRASASNAKQLELNIKQSLITKGLSNKLSFDTTTARRIVRTELVLAYNFGKLSGFSSEEDLDRQMQWNADWELQNKIPGYEVCNACKNMHGRVYTVRYLLEIGSLTDIGILDYNSRNKTDFKNPSLPVIPFHPSCSCSWQILPKSKEVKAPIDVTKAVIDAGINIAAAGLIVTGGFLLARSKAFKSFIKTASRVSDDVSTVVTKTVNTTTKIGEDVIDDIKIPIKEKKITSNNKNTSKLQSLESGLNIDQTITKKKVKTVPVVKQEEIQTVDNLIENIIDTNKIITNLYDDNTRELYQATIKELLDA